MHLHLINYVLWFLTPTIQLGVLVMMYKRGLNVDYPYFFNYTILQVVGEPILAIGSLYSYSFYYYGYWITTALSALISFAVLYEIFRNAFRPYEALRDLSLILFRWSGLVILLVAGMDAITSAQSSQSGPVTDAVFLAARSVRLMQCGLVFFLLLFSEYLGISKRVLLFGITLGFGLFASVNMLVDAGASHLGIINVSVLRTVNSLVYTFSTVIWLGYAAMAPVASKAAAAIRSKGWNEALEDARVPLETESLLDRMDRTVERLLYPPGSPTAATVDRS